MLVQNPALRINIDQICRHKWVKSASVLPMKNCFSASTSTSSTRNTSIVGFKNLNEQNKSRTSLIKQPDIKAPLQTKLSDTIDLSIEYERVGEKPRPNSNMSESLKRSLDIKSFFPKRVKQLEADDDIVYKLEAPCNSSQIIYTEREKQTFAVLIAEEILSEPEINLPRAL